jgi:hypothetical protein
MRHMRRRHRAWVRRLRILVLPACALALAVSASAHAAPAQDLRSPDARDAASAASPAQAQRELAPARSTRVIETPSSGDQTVAIALAGAAIGIALAGLAVALGALFRRPRPSWSVS